MPDNIPDLGPQPGQPGQLARPGRNPAADLGVVAELSGTRTGRVYRWILLVRRVGDRSWALPGGRLNDGESPTAGMHRETLEETGVDFTAEQPVIVLSDCVVDDPRNTAERWTSTTLGVVVVGALAATKITDPAIIDAQWFPITTTPGSVEALENLLRRRTGTTVFRPHPPLIEAVIGEVNLRRKIGGYFDVNVAADLTRSGVPADALDTLRRRYLTDARRNPSVVDFMTKTTGPPDEHDHVVAITHAAPKTIAECSCGQATTLHHVRATGATPGLRLAMVLADLHTDNPTIHPLEAPGHA